MRATGGVTMNAEAAQVAPAPPEGRTPDEPRVDGSDSWVVGAAPPPRPRRSGLVLESDLGVLGFAGRFRHVAPPAYWLRGQLGYELVRWLMVYGVAEVALTDTSESLDESRSMAFALWGFAGGVRATFHASERVALQVQGEAGAIAADVPRGSLALLGYGGAERLDVAVRAGAGLEWYASDRHLALCALAGARIAEGFAKHIGSSDLPLLWDAGGGVRYTF